MGEGGGGTDGRVLRRQRNRTAVLDAFLALLDDGDPRPTGQAIAARAGVSVRTVFHHFSDLEEIFAQAGTIVLGRLLVDLDPVDPALGFDDRLDAFVTRRAHLLEILHPVAQAARLREPFSPQLRHNRDLLLARLRRQLEDAFAPELDALGPHPRLVVTDALAVGTSWSTWYSLREQLLLTPAEAAERLASTVAHLLAPVELARTSVPPLPEPPS